MGNDDSSCCHCRLYHFVCCSQGHAAAPDTAGRPQPPAGPGLPPPAFVSMAGFAAGTAAADVASGSGTATPPPAASGSSSVSRVARTFTAFTDLKRKLEEGAVRNDALAEDVERLKRQKTDAAAESARLASQLESQRTREQVELAARLAGAREKRAQLAAQLADLERQEAELAVQLEPSRQQEAELAAKLERARSWEGTVASQLVEAEKNRKAEMAVISQDAAVVQRQMNAMFAEVTGLFVGDALQRKVLSLARRAPPCLARLRSFVRFSRKRERQDQPRFMCGSHESVSDSTFWTNHVQHQNMNEQVIQIIVHHSRY